MNDARSCAIRRLAAFAIDWLMLALWGGVLLGPVMLATDGNPQRPAGPSQAAHPTTDGQMCMLPAGIGNTNRGAGLLVSFRWTILTQWTIALQGYLKSTYVQAKRGKEGRESSVEAMKSITSRVRRLSGETSDGAKLVDAAFGMNAGPPKVAINPLQTETEKGEQRGFAALLKGLYGTIRNPLGHEAKIEWEMTEQDALDILTTVSLIHRKLDRAFNGER